MDPDPDPTPNPTYPNPIYFKDAKKFIFFVIFVLTCPQAHHLQSKKIYGFFSVRLPHL
jgi:hypothetical protein